MINKRIFILVIFLIYLTGISYSQQDLRMFDIQTEAILEFDLGRPGSGWQIDNYILINGSRAFQYNTITHDMQKFDYYKDVARFYGRYDDSMIIMRRSKDKNLDFQLYIYNPKNCDYKKLDDVPFFLNSQEKLNKIYHYKDNEYIVTYGVNAGGPVYYNTYLINADTGENTLLMRFGKVYDISPDKMHLLLANYSRDYFGVYNIEKKEVISKTEFRGDPVTYFINNEYFFRQKSEGGSIYNLSFEKSIEFNYSPPKDIPNISISLVKILDSEYGYYTQAGTGKRILVNMSGEKKIYEQNGLLFHPVAGTANDSRVRIREWPLLEAKNLGYLTKGDKLEILDRSGIKVKIGEMEDYWYKLRRISDGIEGWSYGAFIDVDEPPPVVDDGSPKSYRILDFDPTIPGPQTN